MALSLNADAALRAYLPPESWNGEAQHRLVFRSQEGEEISLLAPIQPIISGDKFIYCILLRPEHSEAARIFILEGFGPHTDELDNCMTRHEASHFDWAALEQNWNDGVHVGNLSRYWLKQEKEYLNLLCLDSNGWGKIFTHVPPHPENNTHREETIPWRLRTESFIFHPNNQHLRKIDFLQQSDTEFQTQILNDWSDPDGEVQTTIRWRDLSEDEKDAEAFHCQNGDWNELLKIAELALQVRLMFLDILPSQQCSWDLADIDGIYVRGAELFNDPFLWKWRSALMDVFRPDNIGANGNVIVERPLCIWSHIGSSPMSCVNIDSVTYHELMEAPAFLEEWAHRHFSPDEAERLLELQTG